MDQNAAAVTFCLISRELVARPAKYAVYAYNRRCVTSHIKVKLFGVIRLFGILAGGTCLGPMSLLPTLVTGIIIHYARPTAKKPATLDDKFPLPSDSER